MAGKKNGKPQGPDTPADDTTGAADPATDTTSGAPADPPAADPPDRKPTKDDDKPAASVTMVFPHRVVINVGKPKHLVFEEGPNEVPVDVAEAYDWHLKNHGVKPYVKGAKKK